MSLFKKNKVDSEIEKLQKKWKREEKMARFKRHFKQPMQYKEIEVPDWNERTEQLSAFRKAYAEFFRNSGYQENSELQSQSTQLYWHRIYLQKQRLQRLGLTMEMESQRVQRSSVPEESLTENDIFDGRYRVSGINEAISAKRTFLKNGEEIGTFRDHASVDYSILSAQQEGPDEIVCPNCGNITSREDLIDGCDYCGTKFTIEDLEDRVDSFDFEAELVEDGLAEVGWEASNKLAERAGDMVRVYDENFSFWNFKANVYNKLAAIHFANEFQQVNAFSSDDLSDLIGKYDAVVNIDFENLILWDDRVSVECGLKAESDYMVIDGIQRLRCQADMVLFELVDGTIQLRNENVQLELQKSADCMTQNICGPSVLTCKGCGTSLSLMEGKACRYCGRELNLIQHDWVITKYKSTLTEYGESSREYN